MNATFFTNAGAITTSDGPAVFVTKERRDEVVIAAVRARMLGKKSAVWIYDKARIWRGEARLSKDEGNRVLYTMNNQSGRIVRAEYWSYPVELDGNGQGMVEYHGINPAIAVQPGDTINVSLHDRDHDDMADAMAMAMQKLKMEMEMEVKKMEAEAKGSAWEVFRRGKKT